MRSIFLVLLCMIVPIIVLNTEIFSQPMPGRPVSVSRSPSFSSDDTRSDDFSKKTAFTTATPIAETATMPVINSYLYVNPTATNARSTNPTPLAQLDITSRLNDFAATLKNGQDGRVVGVYILGVLSLKVTQQPSNNPAYVNANPGYVTQFNLAAQYGTIGLLAHNYLSGAFFFNLKTGQEVDIIYGDGTIRRYIIVILRHFQALSPLSTASDFVDIDKHSSDKISNTDLFYQIYQGERVVFQTCITVNGNTSWGRLFVIATPIS